MSDSQAAPSEQPRVLLALYNGYRYALYYFDILLKMGCNPVVTAYDKGEINTKIGMPFDLIIHMGLGDKEDRKAGLEKVSYAAQIFPGVPVLVMSGHDPSYALGEVLRKGAADYLQRPVRDKLAPTQREIDAFKAHVRKLLKVEGAKFE
jgi:DNA-binding NtrC family response regulator